MPGGLASPYDRAGEAAAGLGIPLTAAELAALASDNDMGDAEVGALATTFACLAEKRRLASIETLLRLSRLPRREPKTFEGSDFGRIRGGDAAALAKLPALADLYARRNVASIGPEGIGETHLAQAYGRECRMRGAQDVLHQGDGAQGRDGQGARPRRRLARGVVARQAVLAS